MATQAVPSEYQQSLAQLQRRRAIADAMMQESMSPIQQQISGTGNYPIVVRTSPFEVLGKLAQAYGARKTNEQIDQKYADIAKAMSANRDKALQDLSAPSSPTENYGAAQSAIDAGADPAVVGAALRQDKNALEPNSVKEFQYAVKNGYKGSYEDWTKLSGQTSRPSSVQEWEFYNTLPTEMQPKYLEMKRNPNFQVKDVNSVPTVIAPRVAGTTMTPLSSQASEQAAAEGKKQAEARGSQVGEAQGKVTGGNIAKGASAVNTSGLLDIAEPLIDVATGSAGGAAVDAVAKAFGKATSGAQAIASLKVLQAGLMTNMPRMEGPQSDRDVALYREAAGQIGDPTVPAEIKKSAVGTIRQIQQKYIERAAAAGAPSTPPTMPKRVRVDAQGNVIQ